MYEERSRPPCCGMVKKGLFGLSTDEWVALGTISLVVVGGLAILLNGRAGHHAKNAASASKAAAEAAREAVTVQMARLQITFNLCVRFPKDALMEMAAAPITLTCGTNLFVQELRLATTLGRRNRRRVNLACPMRSDVSVPAFVRKGDSVFFDWPGDIPKEGSLRFAYFDVTFSFSEDGPTLKRTLGPDMFEWV